MSAHTYVVGNLGQQPDQRFTASGANTLSFSVGCTPRRKDKDSGQWDDDGAPLWITITLWGEEAERWAEVLNKGDRVSVNGVLKRRTYERRDGGQSEALELVGARDLAVIPKPDIQPATPGPHRSSPTNPPSKRRHGSDDMQARSRPDRSRCLVRVPRRTQTNLR